MQWGTTLKNLAWRLVDVVGLLAQPPVRDSTAQLTFDDQTELTKVIGAAF